MFIHVEELLFLSSVSDTVKLPHAGCWQDGWLLCCMMGLRSFDFSFLVLGRMKVPKCSNCLGDTVDRNCLFQLNIIMRKRIWAYQCSIPEKQGWTARFYYFNSGEYFFPGWLTEKFPSPQWFHNHEVSQEDWIKPWKAMIWCNVNIILPKNLIHFCTCTSL